MVMQIDVQQVDLKKDYTPQEYLDLEIPALERHEYIDGEIILMPGGMPNHNRVVLNFAATLNFALKRQPYDVFITDQRLWIDEKRIYTYPDVMVVQGALQLQEGRKDTITNPTLIAEVLSKSTQAYDQSDKFKFYRTIPTFQEYVLIDQYSIHVEQYHKTDSHQWMFFEYDGEDSILKLKTIPFEISLAELYEKVAFASE
jgi:Uma2 family endonuclease